MTDVRTAEKSATLYQRLTQAECETDHWESDLYVLDTPQARAVIEAYKADGHPASVVPFVGTDGRNWIDVPFAYDPFWDARIVEADEPEAAAPQV